MVLWAQELPSSPGRLCLIARDYHEWVCRLLLLPRERGDRKGWPLPGSLVSSSYTSQPTVCDSAQVIHGLGGVSGGPRVYRLGNVNWRGRAPSLWLWKSHHPSGKIFLVSYFEVPHTCVSNPHLNSVNKPIDSLIHCALVCPWGNKEGADTVSKGNSHDRPSSEWGEQSITQFFFNATASLADWPWYLLCDQSFLESLIFFLNLNYGGSDIHVHHSWILIFHVFNF